MTTNYYDILGVDKNADKNEIKAAFRRKARELHPDVNKAPDAEERFKELGKAYETLSDDDKRALYDRYGEDGLQNAGYSTQGPFDFGFGNLNDIFESFFGGSFSGASSQNPDAPRRGSDLRINVTLEFEEAVFGTEKELTITRAETCEHCKGKGAEPGSKVETCKTCGGTGKIRNVTRTMLGSFEQITVCPDCRGKGKKITQPCKECRGTGQVEKQRKINVKIPAGVDHLTKIRLAGEGDTGINGGQNGDLYVVLYVKDHKKFERRGNDIFSTLDVTFPQAALGADLKVETLDGETTVTVPPGTNHDTILTIKNAGVPFTGLKDKRGSHFVVVKLKAPVNLSAEEKELYSKLNGIKQNNVKHGVFDKVKSVLNKK